MNHDGPSHAGDLVGKCNRGHLRRLTLLYTRRPAELFEARANHNAATENVIGGGPRRISKTGLDYGEDN